MGKSVCISGCRSCSVRLYLVVSQFSFKVEIGGGRKGLVGGGGGLKTPRNRTDIRLKTAKNNIGQEPLHRKTANRIEF